MNADTRERPESYLEDRAWQAADERQPAALTDTRHPSTHRRERAEEFE